MEWKNILYKSLLFYRQYGCREFLRKIYQKISLDFTEELSIIQEYEYRQKEKSVKYALWMQKNKPDLITLEQQRKTRFPKEPLISVVVPTYNGKIQYLEELIESLCKQTYKNWELCMADGCSSHIDIKKYLMECQKKDPRVHVLFLEKNYGISGNTNKAIEIANGDYIAFSDHDDIFSEDALYEIIKAINQNEADLLYTDEDKVNEDSSIYYEPHLKPDFSPDQLRACNYFCHLMVVSRKVLNKVGLLNSTFDGSQDHELALRICDVSDCVIHIPKVLYHWRQFPTSMSKQNLQRCQARGRKAVEEHLLRKNLMGIVEQDHGYRIRYEYGIGTVSVIVLIKNNLLQKIRQVQKICSMTSYRNVEYILVNLTEEDIDSNETVFSENMIMVLGNKGASVYENKNIGASAAHGDFLLFMDSDLIPVTESWVEELLMFAQRSDVGIVGGKILFADESAIYSAGYTLASGIPKLNFYGQSCGIIGNGGQERIVRNVSALPDELFMMKRKDYDEFNGFNENFKFYYGDVDLCLRMLNKGKVHVFTPYATLKLTEINRCESSGQANKNDQILLQNIYEKSIYDRYCRLSYE